MMNKSAASFLESTFYHVALPYVVLLSQEAIKRTFTENVEALSTISSLTGQESASTK
ncbi:hypothetical protein ACIQAA_02630 [Neobacillus sp. NPDC093182]|uniref:hypothetical protein n=1 Tax=Neobacillus sp. NPDC093182 TaxID=3364297 RepID=UPI00382E6932